MFCGKYTTLQFVDFSLLMNSTKSFHLHLQNSLAIIASRCQSDVCQQLLCFHLWSLNGREALCDIHNIKKATAQKRAVFFGLGAREIRNRAPIKNMKEIHTPGHLVWRMRERLQKEAQNYSGAPEFDPHASRAALRQMVADLQTMYPHGHKQRTTTLIESQEIEEWSDALIHHPDGYRKEWGFVIPEAAFDKARVQRPLQLRVQHIATTLTGQLPLNELQAYLGNERGINKHLLYKIADQDRRLNVHSLLMQYQSSHSEGSIDDFIAYLVHESEEPHYSESERKQLDFVANALTGAYQSFMKEYWADNPEIGAAREYLVQNFSELGAEVVMSLESGSSRDGIYRLIRGRVEEILESTIGRDMREVDIDSVVAGFFEFIPDVQKQRGLRKRSADTESVRERRSINTRWLEGLAKDNYGVLEAVNGSKKNPFVRVVPHQHGVARSYHQKDPELAHVDVSKNTVHKDLGLFYTLNTRRADQVAFRIQEAVSHNDEMVIFVPTCPCDEICGVPANGEASHIVSFTGGPLVDGISWTGLNTIDGLSTVLPKLLKKNPSLRVRVVFATGDFEWDNGSTRGMTKEEYFNQLSRNHQSIATYLQEKWGVQQNGGHIPSSPHETHGYSLASTDGRVHVDIQGLMGLAGGREAWITLENHVKENINRRFVNPQYRAQLLELAQCRRVIYEALRGSGALSEDALLNCLREDVISYCAAHGLSRLMYDSEHRRSIILAGDSRPMEELAASIEGTVLLLVAGGYKGS